MVVGVAQGADGGLDPARPVGVGAQAELELDDVGVALADAAQPLLDADAVFVGDELEQALPDAQAGIEPGGVPPGAVEEGEAPVGVGLEEDLVDRLDHVPIHRAALPQHLLGRQPAGHVAHHVEHRRLAVEVDVHAGGLGVDRLAVEALVAQGQRLQDGLQALGEFLQAGGLQGPVVGVHQGQHLDTVEGAPVAGAEQAAAGLVGEVDAPVDAHQGRLGGQLEEQAVALLAGAPGVEALAQGRDVLDGDREEGRAVVVTEDQPGRLAAPQGLAVGAVVAGFAGEVAGLAGQAAPAQGLAAGGVFGFEEAVHRLAGDRVGGASEQVGEGVVHLEPAAVGGDAPDTGRRAGKERAEEGFVFLQLVAGLHLGGDVAGGAAVAGEHAVAVEHRDAALR